ncbi:MAG: hypothetical protein LBE92_10960 [Chryseobacterium sp.]|uniref:hypothetical protein n=1 Tax=Chryseobacterium sp. TaxID=1871047 RepID=UPI0028356079|nr:hypothetical protein [Chryseobacterium sp.]MDR2236634.1 hypothetical protein [Chryseobacterium sp.]
MLFLGVILAVFYCKAQQIYPLNTDYENIPAYSYIKDVNNYLSPFTGIYKAYYQGNEVTLYITKAEHKLKERIDKSYYMDALIVRYTVKNLSGIVLQDTQNNNNGDFYSIWSAPEEDAVVLYYPGTNCMVGWGKVYLFKKNSTQLSWDYRPNSMVLDQQNCPGNQDTKVYLPVTKDLIFTKQ